MPVFVFDEAENYIAVNEAACGLTGYGREELLALKVSDIGGRPVRTRRHLAEVYRRGRNAGAAWIKRKDGTLVEVHYTASTTSIAGIPYMVGICWPQTPNGEPVQETSDGGAEAPGHARESAAAGRETAEPFDP
jgi:PAS domain S-box-containing protein